MAYVTIPKDLSKVKNKVFLNLTKRQLVCMGFAAGIGIPFYFLMRDTLGTSNAAAGMVLLMLPEFFFALYEKNGMHLETILRGISAHGTLLMKRKLAAKSSSCWSMRNTAIWRLVLQSMSMASW